jgi:4-hydroxybenzoate polyprenyltransferase
MLVDLIALTRPTHWSKNVFVLMPAPFAIAAGGEPRPLQFALGVIGFCLVNSAVYAVNDVLDAGLDRHHPGKKDRPVASGRIGKPAALLFGGALLAVGIGLVSLVGIRTAYWIIGAYVGLNLAYSLQAKHVPLLDVFILAFGFVLRVLLGCALLRVAPSNWLLLCSSTLALLLALGKRRADVVAGIGGLHRGSLAGYTRAFLEQAISITAAVVLLSYALYCMEAEVLVSGREFTSLPFVAYGVLEYLRLLHGGADGGSPVDLVLSSRSMLICGAGWTAAALWSTGFL